MRPLKHTDDADVWSADLDGFSLRMDTGRVNFDPCPNCESESFNVTFDAAAVVTDYSDGGLAEIDMGVSDVKEIVCRVCGRSMRDYMD